jgi:methylated-DNA-[protein]-cysteine S-methyltransferase
MACCWESDLVAALTFGHATADLAKASLLRLLSEATPASAWRTDAHYEPTDGQADLLERFNDFADGRTVDFRDVKLSLDDLTPFQRKVISLCRKIGWGRTVSYGQLARDAGRPGAARAVGTVMSRNRFPLIVPCHRVVGSQGDLCGFSAPDGTTMKLRLLQREGAIRAQASSTTRRSKPR